MKPVIGITMGDFNGIGPEVTLKALLSSKIHRICTPVLIGSFEVYEWYARKLKMKIIFREETGAHLKSSANYLSVYPIRPYQIPRFKPGVLSEEAGAFAGESIDIAIRLCMEKKLNAMVTAPVSKKAMEMGGFNFPGQTEMLAERSRSKKVIMMLLAGSFRVGLATVHIPIQSVSKSITSGLILEKLSTLQSSLQRDFTIAKPNIAVLGLNPHAGENGKIGSEELNIIIPALKKARRLYYRVDGPFPADGFFGNKSHLRYDAILAMYHDQGLIPLKMMGFEKGVNFSAGLNIVRMSPDHGTGFDIAGKGIADERSMMEAITLAVNISGNRQKAK